MKIIRSLLLTLFVIPILAVFLLIPFVNYFVLIQIMEMLWHQAIVVRTAKIECLVAIQNVRNTKNG